MRWARTDFVVKEQNGWRLTLRPMERGLQRLEESPLEGHGMGRYWCYETHTAAVLAAIVWEVDPHTEPVGWVSRGGVRA